MTMTSEGTYEPRARTRAGVEDTMEQALGDTMTELARESPAVEWPTPPQTAEVPRPPDADAALAAWAQALVEAVATNEREKFIEVAGAQNEGIKAMIEGRFAELHDPYRVFLWGLAAGVGVIVLAVLMVTALGVLFLFATGR